VAPAPAGVGNTGASGARRRLPTAGARRPALLRAPLERIEADPARRRGRASPWPRLSVVCQEQMGQKGAAQQPAGSKDDGDAAYHSSLGGQSHPPVLLKGTASNSKFQLEMGPYDLIPPPAEESVAAMLEGRPVFKQRTGSSVLYFIDGCWVVGSNVGSFEGVSFFAQDAAAMSPCDVACQWYELAGEEGALCNPSVYVEPLPSGELAQMLQLAAEQSTSITTVRKNYIPPQRRAQEFLPADVNVEELTDDMQLLLDLLTSSSAATFNDAAWLRVNEAYKRVLNELCC
jgi:hypothetical protein